MYKGIPHIFSSLTLTIHVSLNFLCDFNEKKKWKLNVLRLLGNKFLSNVPSSWWDRLLVFDKSKMQMFRLTCFLGEGLNHLTGRSTPGTIARPDVHRVLGVRQKVLQPGRVLLAVDLNSVCSCFFVMSWPVPNLQTFKLSNSLSWCRHLNCEKFFSADCHYWCQPLYCQIFLSAIYISSSLRP